MSIVHSYTHQQKHYNYVSPSDNSRTSIWKGQNKNFNIQTLQQYKQSTQSCLNCTDKEYYMYINQ